MEKVYRGWLCLRSNGEEDDILSLSDNPFRSTKSDYISELLSREIGGEQVTARYYITDISATVDEAQESFVRELMGGVDAKYHARYSEYTGYLWTDEELNIGGHDLLNELKGYVGKYLNLLVTVHT